MRVNDIHSRLNSTDVASVVEVDSPAALQSIVRDAVAGGRQLSVSGGRHAMGGQQFASGATLVDTRPMARMIDFDAAAGLVVVEAGIQWPALIAQLVAAQRGRATQWGIRQKQTGADRFTIGGSISANGHGRGLAMRPLVDDVEQLELVRADGETTTCSRTENADLFGLVVGGYGLFGAIASVTLRLSPRVKLARHVEIVDADQLVAAFADRIAEGYLYGDFQFAIDDRSPHLLRRGVFSCYRPVDPETPFRADQRALSRENWQMLLSLAHSDKARAFDEYARHYLATDGQIYWSDLHQLADYVDGYHETLDALSGVGVPATEMITEVYVPRRRLADFLAEAADDVRTNGVDVIYGTIRLVERDEQTFLPWAREAYACVIVNVHTPHTDGGIAHTRAALLRLIDLALARGGSFFLTYHRWASRDQICAAYPRFAEFLHRKSEVDPTETFTSEWYRHHVRLFAGDR